MSDTLTEFINFISEDPLMLGLSLAIIVLVIIFILVLFLGNKKTPKIQEKNIVPEEKLENTSELLKSEIDDAILKSTQEYSVPNIMANIDNEYHKERISNDLIENNTIKVPTVEDVMGVINSPEEEILNNNFNSTNTSYDMSQSNNIVSTDQNFGIPSLNQETKSKMESPVKIANDSLQDTIIIEPEEVSSENMLDNFIVPIIPEVDSINNSDKNEFTNELEKISVDTNENALNDNLVIPDFNPLDVGIPTNTAEIVFPTFDEIAEPSISTDTNQTLKDQYSTVISDTNNVILPSSHEEISFSGFEPSLNDKIDDDFSNLEFEKTSDIMGIPSAPTVDLNNNNDSEISYENMFGNSESVIQGDNTGNFIDDDDIALPKLNMNSSSVTLTSLEGEKFKI